MDLSRREVLSPLANFVTRKLSELRNGKFSGTYEKGRPKIGTRKFSIKSSTLCAFFVLRDTRISYKITCAHLKSPEILENIVNLSSYRL